MSKQSKVWDRFANSYAKSPVEHEDTYQKKLEITRQYLQPDMDVLEFGCGTGSTAIAHAPFVKSITGIDLSDKMLSFAREKVEKANITNITFERSGIEEFQPKGEPYNVVMGHSILHLLKDKEMVIAKVFKMLKPGGIFVSSTVVMGGTAKFMQIVLPIGTFLGLLPIIQFFTADELEKSLKNAGFEIEHKWHPGKNRAVFFVAKKPG